MSQESATNVSGSLQRLHRRIEEKAKDRTARPIVIVAIGDSVTQGVAEVDHLLHNDVYHAQLKKLLEKQYPLTTFSVINSGVDGDTATAAAARFSRDAIAYQPDLLLIGFALNDSVAGFEGLKQYTESINTLINRTRSETEADLVILTPNMMLTRENDAIPEKYAEYTELMLNIQNQGILASYVDRLREVAKEQSVPVADVYEKWATLASQGTNTTAMLSNGLNHPDPAGHALAAETIFNVIQTA